MSKPLSEMSLVELWELFPIQLKGHQACWEEWYQIEKGHLVSILPNTVKINHIGSTAINGIWAKPIIDIIVEANLSDYEAIKNQLLCNTYGGWMSLYDGIGTDKIVHGGTYIEKHGFGGEVYNFRNSGGKNYGYVMTKSGTLDLSRIDYGQETVGDVIKNVTCVFVATHPMGGRRIVGWYRNASIYSCYQDYPGSDREIMTSQEDWGPDSNQVGYFALAQNGDVILLTEDERLDAPVVPNGKGGFGQSNVWYADSDIGIKFRRKTIKFISEYERKIAKEAASEQKRDIQSNVDAIAKKKVEEVAIKRTREYFEVLGYVCKSVESENLGWDLEFTKANFWWR